ncbi:MAG TPA: response regulator [Bacteroidia bacterium]|nr:response regulator [Bacteroidia bacterium]HNU33498.1 response regulator [Bacteroidia bacterium]
MKKILLIEDNKEVRENTAEILELAGYLVATAPDGKKGVEEVKKSIPDLIICDIMMPVLDGYGVLHMLNKDSKTSSIPFIFLTAKAERSDMRKGMEMGADDYITKPFDKIELLNAVESRLRKADSIKKEYASTPDGIGGLIGDISGDDALKKFTEGKKTKFFRKKEHVYREGDIPRGLFYLNKGKLKVYKVHEYGKELIISLLNEGDFFGYTSLLEEHDYNESVQAIEDVEIVFIPKEDFVEQIFNNREISKKFVQLLTHNVTEKQNQLLNLAYSSVRKRVASALLLLQKRFKKTESQSPYSMSFSREDLASIAGTATESLIRTLSDFKDEKLIEIKEGKIVLINDVKLREIKN